jgi:hypothetical protein
LEEAIERYAGISLDDLREVGYALKKLGIEWENISQTA